MNVLVDVNYLESDQAFRLRAVLGNACAELYPIRLWGWALMTDRVSGRFVADAKQIANIVKFDQDPQIILRAFLDCGIIENTEKADEFRIRGWRLNKKLFKERDRLRKFRAYQKRTRTKVVQNADGTPLSSSSSSSSSLSSKESSGARPRPGANHPEVAFFEAAYRERFGGPALSAFERSDVFDVIRQTGEAKVRWQQVLESYGKGFAFSGHTITWLKKNLREVLNKMPAPQRDVVASIADQDARNKAQLEEFA